MIQVILALYHRLLRTYPRRFRTEFEAEMRVVFAEMLNEAAQQGLGLVVGVGLRELFQWPQALLRAHWLDWRERRRAVAHWAASLPPAPALPPPPLDGRQSWMQAGLEISPFLAAGAMLLTITYLPAAWPAATWHGSLDLASAIAAWLAFTGSLVGLAYGLPRWAYPLGELWLGRSFQLAFASDLWPLLVVCLLASAVVAIVAALVNSYGEPLPLPLRRMGQSLRLDWTRLSFAVYGALPMLISAAFDDARFHNRAPFVAVAALLMIAGALAYSRSRRRSLQMAVLMGGLSVALGSALLDQAFNWGGRAWIGDPRFWQAEVGWTLTLWASVSVLLWAPALLGLVRKYASRHTAPDGRT